MSLDKKQLITKAKYLLTVFELYNFQNRLGYSRALNLILEFCDYIAQMPDWQLLAELESEYPLDAKSFRQLVETDIDKWLAEEIKTIYL